MSLQPSVPTWLHSIGLPQYEKNFSKAGYEGKDDVENLVEITEEEMRKELKITKLGKLRRHLTETERSVNWRRKR